jgi:hypothetical protein
MPLLMEEFPQFKFYYEDNEDEPADPEEDQYRNGRYFITVRTEKIDYLFGMVCYTNCYFVDKHDKSEIIDKLDQMGRNDLGDKLIEYIENGFQDKLTELLKSTDNGLGFEPTIKNMISIIMANSEAFLRLMCDTHELAWDKRNNPIRMGVIQDKDKTVTSPDLKDYVDINDENLIPVYPWPLFFVEKSTPDGEKYILQYIKLLIV